MPPRAAAKGEASRRATIAGTTTNNAAAGSSRGKQVAPARDSDLSNIDSDSDTHSEHSNKIRNVQVATPGLRRSARTSTRNAPGGKNAQQEEGSSDEDCKVAVKKGTKGGKRVTSGKVVAQLGDESRGEDDGHEPVRARAPKRKRAKNTRGSNKKVKRAKAHHSAAGKTRKVHAQAEDTDGDDVESDEDEGGGDGLGHIERGGPAAQQVWNTVDIRERVFALLDKHTLTSMARVEKGATASTARFLYHTIPSSIVSGMSRTRGRRVVYCDAVRVIDQTYFSLPAKHSQSYADRYDFAQNLGSRGIASLLQAAEAYLRKFPNLTRVENEFPPRTRDARFILHVGPNGRRDLDLHEYHQLEVELRPDDQMPARRVFAGIHDLRHPLTLYWFRSHWPPADDVKRWQTWLESGQLDQRVVGFDFDTFDTRRCGDKMKETIKTLRNMQRNVGANRWPLTRVELPEMEICVSSLPDDIDVFKKRLLLLAPSIRQCRIRLRKGPTEPPSDTLLSLFDTLSQVVPHLEELSLIVDAAHLSAISVLSFGTTIESSTLALRRFHVDVVGRESDISRLRLARIMAVLGSSRCYYSFGAIHWGQVHNTPLEIKDKFLGFNRFVRLVQSAIGKALRVGERDMPFDNYMFAQYGGVDGNIIDISSARQELESCISSDLLREADESVAKLEAQLLTYIDHAKAWRDGLKASGQLLRKLKDGQGLRELSNAWKPVHQAHELCYDRQGEVKRAMTLITRIFRKTAKRGAWVDRALCPAVKQEN